MKEAMSCNDCGGDRFVWDRDGDVTCTGCGLVWQERYIDDHCDHQDLERVAFLYQEDDASCMWKREMLPYMMGFDEVIQAYAEKMFDIYCKSSKKNDTKRAIMANCLFYASIALKRSFTIEEITGRLDISNKDFWANFYDVRDAMKGESFYADIDPVKADTLSRLVYSIDGYFGGFDKWRVIRTCHHISEACGDCGAGAKKNKMNASIVYVSLCACGVKVKHKEFCGMMNISEGTLKKHEATIQACLRSA